MKRSNANYETMEPSKLYNLLVDNLVTETDDNTASIHVEKGKISDYIRSGKGGNHDTVWLSLDPSSMIMDRNRITCILRAEGRTIRFEAGVSIQPGSNGASSYFIKARTTNSSWIDFAPIDKKFIPHGKANKGKEELDEKQTKGTTAKKRDREVSGADRELARTVFDALWDGSDADSAHPNVITLEIMDGPIRKKVQKPGGAYWLTLDYKGNHRYSADIITFKAVFSDRDDLVFKAYITTKSALAGNHGDLLVQIIATPSGQERTFEISGLKDRSGDEPVQSSDQDDDEEDEPEYGGVIDMLSDNDDVDEAEMAAIKKPKSVSVDDDCAEMGRSVAIFMRNRIIEAKEKTDRQKDEIKKLRDQLMEMRALKQTMDEDCELLRSEVEMLKSGITFANNQKVLFEHKVTALEKTLREKPITVEAPIPSGLTLEQEKKIGDLTRQNTDLQLKLRASETKVKSITTELQAKAVEMETLHLEMGELRARPPVAPVVTEEAIDQYIITHMADLTQRPNVRESAMARLKSYALRESFDQLIVDSPDIRDLIESGVRVALDSNKDSQ